MAHPIYPASENLRSHLIKLFETYEKATGTSPGLASRRLINDWNVPKRLVDGFDIRLTTYDRLIAGFNECWPAGTRWPTGVPRPPKMENADGPQG